MPLHFLPGDVLPGHLQGLALCFGALPLTHGFTFQDTGPTSAYPGHYPWPLLLRASSSPVVYGWHLLCEGTSLTEDHWRLLRSQFPWLASVGRCSPPGLSAVQTGQYRRLPAPYPVPFWLQRVSLLRWFAFTMAQCTFACAAHRCLLDGIPGMRLPGSAVYPRFRPLRTSRRPGGYAVTPALGGRDLHPHGKLSYKVHTYLAVYPEAEASFRPTGRTSTNAVLICQPHTASTCWTAASVPNTTRCVTPTRRRRRTVFTTCA